MGASMDRACVYRGLYHAVSVGTYAEEVFQEAVNWIEAHNRENPEDSLTLSKGLLRLAEIGLKAEGV